MQGEEIRRRIASFPTWHYQLDLKGNLTPIHKEDRVNRHRQRKEYFFDPLVDMFGGTLAGKRVLDLGCNAGFWLRHERLEKPRHAIDYELVMYPTWEGVHELVRQFRYFVVTLGPRFEGYAGGRSYQKGERRAFLFAKRTVISHVPAGVEEATSAPSPMYAWRERQLRHRERRVQSLEQSQQRLKQRVREHERQLQSMQASKTWKLLNKLARVRARVSSLRRAPTT
jgi:hypothetical protein